MEETIFTNILANALNSRLIHLKNSKHPKGYYNLHPAYKTKFWAAEGTSISLVNTQICQQNNTQNTVSFSKSNHEQRDTSTFFFSKGDPFTSYSYILQITQLCVKGHISSIEFRRFCSFEHEYEQINNFFFF
jgi:hypothetical protein